MNLSPAGNNLAMLLTPRGVGAIAVVRLRGLGTGVFLRKYFSRQVRAGRCVHGELREGDRVIDDPVVVVSEDESWADISVHGGTWVVNSVLELARREGFAVEETVGAHGGFEEIGSVFERELAGHLPLARTEMGIRMLLGQREAWGELLGEKGLLGNAGGGHMKIHGLKSGDFANEMNDEIGRIIEDKSLWWLLHPPQVAIVGAANAGKSTLANQLFGQERSITADLPGTTRDWVGEIANVDGLAVMLVDTPGIRRTDDELEAAAIVGSREKIAGSDLVVLVLDRTQEIRGQDELMRRWPEAIWAMNKMDQPAAWELNLESRAGEEISICALSGAGIDDLRSAIRRRFGLEDLSLARPRWWTERQKGILERAVVDASVLDELGIAI